MERIVKGPIKEQAPVEQDKLTVGSITFGPSRSAGCKEQVSVNDWSTSGTGCIPKADLMPNFNAFSKALKKKHDPTYRHQRGKELTESLGLRYVHVRTGYTKGGVTVAFVPHVRPLNKPVNAVRVSTAICHPNDAYCKWEGRYYAAKNFADGRTIDVHIPEGSTIGETLQAMFGVSLGLVPQKHIDEERDLTLSEFMQYLKDYL